MADIAGRAARSRGGGKSASAFRTISEVAAKLHLPQHVLRFWEAKFPQVKPLKRGGGRRYYRPEDIELLQMIRGLLYHDGYTIKGVQRLLREGAVKAAGRKDRLRVGGGNGPEAAAPAAARAHSPRAAQGGTTDRSAGFDGGLDEGRRRAIEAVIDELAALRKLLKGAGA